MIDIHAHCIPSMDDGPEYLDEALMLLRQASSQGVTDIITTSHFRLPAYDNENLTREREKLSECIEREGLGIQLHQGNEVYADEHARTHLENGTIQTLADSKYVLLELPAQRLYPIHREIIYDLQRDGYRVVLAHVDRYPYLMLDLPLLESLIHTGCYAQFNGSYILQKPKEAKRMIENNYVHFIASDMHHVVNRPCVMKSTKEIIDLHCGKDWSYKLLVKNPRHILQDMQLEIDLPKKVREPWFKLNWV